MGMINTVIEDADYDASTCDAFTPDRNNVDIVANSAARLTSIYLNTAKICQLTVSSFLCPRPLGGDIK